MSNTNPPKRLYLGRREDSKISGVCSGLAEYFNVDTAVVRFLALMLLFFGPGILVYICLAIALPNHPSEQN